MSSEGRKSADIGDIVMDGIKDVVRERLGEKAASKLDCKDARKRISKKVFEYLFYELLATGKVRFPPGLGTLQVMDVKRKVAKVFDKKSNTMVERPVSGKRVVYRPGDTIREFL